MQLSKNLKVVLVDDEPPANQALATILNQYCSNVEIMGICTNTLQARECIYKQKPDVLFLDISMPYETGLEFLHNLNFIDFQVIFVTASDEFAVAAFDFGALDYIKKPLEISRVKQAIEKASRFILYEEYSNQKSWALNLMKSKPTRIPVRHRSQHGDITKLLEADKVSYVEAYGSSVLFHLTDGTRMVSGKNLGHYSESLINLFGFLKIGRSYLVNPDEIDSFNNSEGYLILKAPAKSINPTGYKLHVSREVRQDLLETIKYL
jgi:two-component system, LytTR family, response regulator